MLSLGKDCRGETSNVRPLASGSLFSLYDLFARKYRKQELWFSFSNLLLDSTSIMFGDKRLEAPVTLLREEKEGDSVFRTGKGNLMIKGVCNLACEQEKLTEKGIFIMAFLSRIGLMWNGLSSVVYIAPTIPTFFKCISL